MARFRLLFSLLAIAVLSGCTMFSSSVRFGGKTEAIISDVISPNLLYVGAGEKHRKIHLLGVAPIDKDHENYEFVMKALGTLKGTEIRIRFQGKNFWRSEPLYVLVFYDRLHEVLPETGSSIIDENVLLNAYILKHGFGRFKEAGQRIPVAVREELQQAEEDARSTGLGVWERAKLGE